MFLVREGGSAASNARVMAASHDGGGDGEDDGGWRQRQRWAAARKSTAGASGRRRPFWKLIAFGADRLAVYLACCRRSVPPPSLSLPGRNGRRPEVWPEAVYHDDVPQFRAEEDAAVWVTGPAGSDQDVLVPGGDSGLPWG